jgi:hypothetical protein
MMIILEGWNQMLFLILMMAVALKALIGFHWSWEKCKCCGEKYREHRKEDLSLQNKKPISLPYEMREDEESRPFKEGYRPPPKGKTPKPPKFPPSTKPKNRIGGR